jgi:hypothetical protein
LGLYTNYKQWMLDSQPRPVGRKKELWLEILTATFIENSHHTIVTLSVVLCNEIGSLFMKCMKYFHVDDHLCFKYYLVFCILLSWSRNQNASYVASVLAFAPKPPGNTT